MITIDLNRDDELRFWNRQVNEYQKSMFVNIRQIETLKLVDDFDEWLRLDYPHLVTIYGIWKRGGNEKTK